MQVHGEKDAASQWREEERAMRASPWANEVTLFADTRSGAAAAAADAARALALVSRTLWWHLTGPAEGADAASPTEDVAVARDLVREEESSRNASVRDSPHTTTISEHERGALLRLAAARIVGGAAEVAEGEAGATTPCVGFRHLGCRSAHRAIARAATTRYALSLAPVLLVRPPRENCVRMQDALEGTVLHVICGVLVDRANGHVTAASSHGIVLPRAVLDAYSQQQGTQSFDEIASAWARARGVEGDDWYTACEYVPTSFRRPDALLSAGIADLVALRVQHRVEGGAHPPSVRARWVHYAAVIAALLCGHAERVAAAAEDRSTLWAQTRVVPHRGVPFLDVVRLFRNPQNEARLRHLTALALRGMQAGGGWPHLPRLAVAPVASRGYLLGHVLKQAVSEALLHPCPPPAGHACPLDAAAVKLVPIFKADALPPSEVIVEEAVTEYSRTTLATHADTDLRGIAVVLMDDLLGTGGTFEAAAKLVRRLGGEVAGAIVIAAVPSLLESALRRLPFPVAVLLGA